MSVPSTAPTVKDKPGYPDLRSFLRDFRGNPVRALVTLLPLGGIIALFTGIGGGLLNHFK